MVSKSTCGCFILAARYGQNVYIIGCEGEAIIDGVRVKDACTCAFDRVLDYVALGTPEVAPVSGLESWFGAWSGQGVNPQ